MTPMALYAHVADKDEILDEVLDDALAADARPAPPGADSREWMVGFAEQLHGVLTSRRELLDRYCRRPVGVTTALERMEAALSVLSGAGFDDVEAVDVFAAVQTVTLGFTVLQVARATATAPECPAAGDDRSRPGLRRYWPAYFATLPPAAFPHLVRSQPDLAAFTSADRFRQVLRSLLDGISPAPASRPSAKGRRRAEGSS